MLKLYIGLLIAAIVIFSVVISWLLREAARLNRRIDFLEDRLIEQGYTIFFSYKNGKTHVRNTNSSA